MLSSNSLGISNYKLLTMHPYNLKCFLLYWQQSSKVESWNPSSATYNIGQSLFSRWKVLPSAAMDPLVIWQLFSAPHERYLESNVCVYLFVSLLKNILELGSNPKELLPLRHSIRTMQKHKHRYRHWYLYWCYNLHWYWDWALVKKE